MLEKLHLNISDNELHHARAQIEEATGIPQNNVVVRFYEYCDKKIGNSILHQGGGTTATFRKSLQLIRIISEKPLSDRTSHLGGFHPKIIRNIPHTEYGKLCKTFQDREIRQFKLDKEHRLYGFFVGQMGVEPPSFNIILLSTHFETDKVTK